jgi:hypothetical protein
LGTYASRPKALDAEAQALDDIARCIRILHLLRPIYRVLRVHPRTERVLTEMIDLVIALKHSAQARRDEASRQI